MNKNYIIIAIILVVIIAGTIFIMSAQNPTTEIKQDATNIPTNNQPQSEIKEFKINSFYDDAGVWFSLKEIVVKKGDTVKIEVTNIKGMHDFVIDEYNISKETPLNVPTIIQFKADKAGEFIYYCSKPGHREKGQWGTLKVVE